jgi:ubiquinone/menaquinone biosynthesis C-methylase UbiE
MTEPTSSHPPTFSGSALKHYDQFYGPLFFEPYAIEVSNRIDPASVSIALELAAGTGRVTRHLRKVLPGSAKLIASDINADILGLAKQKLKNENIDWQIIDAQQLPFEDNSIDLVVCYFGYMFVPDKAKAFAEAFRVLRPGGRLLFTTWDRLESNGASFVYRKIAEKYLSAVLPASFDLPVSMYDQVEIKELLQNAGFSKTFIEKSAKLSVSATAKHAAAGLTQTGPIYNEIMKQNPAWVEEIKTSLEKELREKYGDAPMVAPMSAVISQAWK